MIGFQCVVVVTCQVLFAKGAPEMLVKRCTKIMMPDGSVEDLTDQWRAQIENELDKSLGRTSGKSGFTMVEAAGNGDIELNVRFKQFKHPKLGLMQHHVVFHQQTVVKMMAAWLSWG
jgi:hypothetical protein